jgi:hypothetical protein
MPELIIVDIDTAEVEYLFPIGEEGVPMVGDVIIVDPNGHGDSGHDFRVAARRFLFTDSHEELACVYVDCVRLSAEEIDVHA